MADRAITTLGVAEATDLAEDTAVLHIVNPARPLDIDKNRKMTRLQLPDFLPDNSVDGGKLTDATVALAKLAADANASIVDDGAGSGGGTYLSLPGVGITIAWHQIDLIPQAPAETNEWIGDWFPTRTWSAQPKIWAVPESFVRVSGTGVTYPRIVGHLVKTNYIPGSPDQFSFIFYADSEPVGVGDFVLRMNLLAIGTLD